MKLWQCRKTVEAEIDTKDCDCRLRSGGHGYTSLKPESKNFLDLITSTNLINIHQLVHDSKLLSDEDTCSDQTQTVALQHSSCKRTSAWPLRENEPLELLSAHSEFFYCLPNTTKPRRNTRAWLRNHSKVLSYDHHQDFEVFLLSTASIRSMPSNSILW